MGKRFTATMIQILIGLIIITIMLFVYLYSSTKSEFEFNLSRMQKPESARDYETLIESLNASTSDLDTLDNDSIIAARARIAAYEEAASYLEQNFQDLPLWLSIHKNFLDEWDSWSLEQWEEVQTLLDTHAEYVDSLRKLAKMSGPIYAIDFSEGIHTEFPHLSIIREFVRLLAIDAKVQARQRNYEAAVSDLVSQLDFAESLSKEPYYSPQLAAMACIRIASDAYQDMIPPGKLPKLKQEQLLGAFDSSFDRKRFIIALETESIMYIEELNNDYNSRYHLPPLVPFWWKSNINKYLEIEKRFIEATEIPYYDALEQINDIQQDIDNLPQFYIIASVHLSLHKTTYQQIVPVYAETSLGLLHVGITLENYYATHGSYPVTLDTIAPMLGEYVIDPFTGKPFIYHPKDESFTLYSVGVNLEDNSGMHDYRDGDIVWRKR